MDFGEDFILGWMMGENSNDDNSNVELTCPIICPSCKFQIDIIFNELEQLGADYKCPNCKKKYKFEILIKLKEK